MSVSDSKHEPQDKNHTITYSEVKPLVKHVLKHMNISAGMYCSHLYSTLIKSDNAF